MPHHRGDLLWWTKPSYELFFVLPQTDTPEAIPWQLEIILFAAPA